MVGGRRRRVADRLIVRVRVRLGVNVIGAGGGRVKVVVVTLRIVLGVARDRVEDASTMANFVDFKHSLQLDFPDTMNLIHVDVEVFSVEFEKNI